MDRAASPGEPIGAVRSPQIAQPGGGAAPRQWEFQAPVQRSETLEGLLGLEVVERKAGLIRGRLSVRDAVRGSSGAVHGGAYATVAESLASIGTLDGVAHDGLMARVSSSGVEVLHPISAGVVQATARLTHRAEGLWYWEVRLTNGENELCALCRVHMAIGPG